MVGETSPNVTYNSAPGIVRGVGDKLMEHRSIRDFLDDSYDGTSDAAATLNPIFEEFAAAGKTIYGPAMRVRAEAPLIIPTGLKLKNDPNCVYVRAFNAGGPNALFRTDNWDGADAHDWSIEGGQFRPLDQTTGGGVLFCVYGNNWSIRNIVARDWHGGQAFLFGGENVLLQGIDARNTSETYGTGCFRCIGGRSIRVIGCHGESGDDVFQFVPSTNSAFAKYDRSILDSFYIGCTGRSTAARFLIAAIGGTQNQNVMTCQLRRLTFAHCNGGGARRSVNVENTEGTAAARVDDILFLGCHIDGSGEIPAGGTAPQDQSVHIVAGLETGGIGRVTFRDCSFSGTPAPNGIGVKRCDDLVLDNCEVYGAHRAISAGDVADTGRVVIRGGSLSHSPSANVSVATFGGGASQEHVVEELVIDDLEVRDVSSNQAAIRLNSVGFAQIDGLVARKAPGATNTMAVSTASGMMARIGEPRGDVDTVLPGLGGASTVIRRIGRTSQYVNLASLADGAQQSMTVAVAGAAPGDRAEATLAAPLQGTRLWAEVSAANTVTVYQRNDSGAPVDLGSALLRVVVTREA